MESTGSSEALVLTVGTCLSGLVHLLLAFPTGTLTNAVVGSVNKCTHKVEYFAYGYNPSKAAGVIFSLAFGLCTLVHTFQAFKGRRWFVLFTMVLCGAIETLGVSVKEVERRRMRAWQ